MLDNIVKRIVNETNKLQLTLDKNDNEKYLYDIITKILNNVTVKESDLNQFWSIISNDTTISSKDKDTLEFIITILLPNGIKMEQSQRNILESYLKKLDKKDGTSIGNKINRNNKVVTAIKSDNVFMYFDALNDIFDEYDMDLKIRLNIIKDLIKRNYHVKDIVITEKQKEYDNKSKGEVITSDIASKSNCPSVDINTSIDEQGILDNKVDKKEVITSNIVSKSNCTNEEIVALFKKYKLYYAKLDDNLKQKISKYGVNKRGADCILDCLGKLGINIKKLYNMNQELFVNLLLFAKIEYINEVISIASNRNIDVCKLINCDISIFYSVENGGMFDNFINIIDFLDSIKYPYVKTNIDLLFVDYYQLKSAYYLYKEQYKLHINDKSMVWTLATKTCFTMLDWLIEISRDAVKRVEESNLFMISGCSVYVCYKHKLNDDFSDYNIDNLQEDKHQYPELNKLFQIKKDKSGYNILLLPPTVGINLDILNNDYVDYLEKNYKVNDILYLINKTRVSRIKVLRVLSYLVEKNIEITEEIVSYALKFNYLFVYNDLENINNAFKNKITNKEGIKCKKL